MKRMSVSSIVIAALFASSLVFANSQSDPSTCPDATAIKSRGLNYAIVLTDNNNTWQAAWLPSDKYQTEQDWIFYLGGAHDDSAKDEEEAMNKANASLQTLSFLQGPLNDNSSWLCYYRTDSKAAGIAITPPEAIFKLTKFRP